MGEAAVVDTVDVVVEGNSTDEVVPVEVVCDHKIKETEAAVVTGEPLEKKLTMPPRKRLTNSVTGLKVKLQPKELKRKKKPLQRKEKNVLPHKVKKPHKKNYLNPNLKKLKSVTLNGKLNRRRKINLN